MDSQNTDSKPHWLKELQLKSWEPEILLSGIVLYGMFQVPKVLDEFLFFFDNEIFNYINAMDLFIAILKVGVYWLIIGLILHLICRGLWIGMVGLNYSFPKGIVVEKLRFQPKYLTKVKAIPPFEAIILKLEYICSFIYSVSFLLFMSLVGTCIYFSVLTVFPMMTILYLSGVPDESLINHLNAYSSYVLIFGMLGVIDFLTMGYFRRFRILAWLFWPIYQLFNYLTLARYYRPTYFTIVTNLKRGWLFLFLLIFALSSYVITGSIQRGETIQNFSRIVLWSDQLGNKAFEGYYQDKENTRPSAQVQIPSDIIRDDVLRVFIPVRINRQDSLKKFVNYDAISSVSSDSLDRGRYYLDKISEFYNFSIADSSFDTKMYFQERSKTQQRGHVTYLNIGFLEEGLYELKIEGPKEMYDEPFAIVPFYKLN